MSSLSFFVLLYLSLHACNARRLGFFAQEIGDRVDFLASKDANKLKAHTLETEPAISKKLQTVQVGAKSVKQALLSPFLQEKEDVANPISAGYGIISSSRVDLQNVEKAEGLKRAKARLMLGAGVEEALDCKEKDNVGDIDVMDYAQPHRKPPIHNQNIKH
ncbi:uncharacterized protein LOC120117228 [Hibiscus syriacus]|uniref:uncharacterized protein LOC120117228 n=1 Tax=Hibiscus syriacus TaxID=106335 RepID=UPI0019239871|nr:uncharacterized protein LOC120117228 [Hibiscus syriacus]